MTTESPRSVTTADVLRGDERVGTITRTTHGAVFEYDAAFVASRPPGDRGIAFHLPCARPRVETLGVNLHPFFAGLLPEGLRLEALRRWVKTAEDDLFSLLLASGADTVGDVSVVAPGTTAAVAPPEADVRTLDAHSFEELLAGALAPPAGTSAPRASIPGVQPKLSAARATLALRGVRGGRTWILKLAPKDLPRLVENEAYFLDAASRCGLAVPAFEIVHDRTGAAGLLVERFDRRVRRGAPPVRLHQEDACQFLDRYPAEKYRLTLADVAAGLEEHCSAPAVAVAFLLRLQAFSYAIGNGDLHARNVSVLRAPDSGLVRPTPAYDLLSTIPYGDERMALAMEGRDQELRREHFVAFGARHAVPAPAVLAILRDVRDGVAACLPHLETIGLDARATRHLRAVIQERLGDLA